jgi:D-amino peptidase
MTRWLASLLLALALSSQALAAPPKLKVYISADMEGICGVASWDKQASPKAPDYGQYRKLMTLDVNAAIAGAFDAGATEVLVSDSHWDGMNIDPELLDRRARIVRSWPRPLIQMGGIDATFDAVFLVGYHASEGTPGAMLAHTMDGGAIQDIKLNGTSVPEAGFAAAQAGDVGVPVVFVSGDQAIARQARELLGTVETAVVKTSDGFFSGTMLHPEECQRLIREGARKGVERRKELKPFRLSHPVKLEIAFKQIVLAEVVSYLPGVERPSGKTIVFTGKDMLEVSRFFGAVSYIEVK